MSEIPDIETRHGALPNLWRASELPGLHGGIKADGIGSGFMALDEALFDRGWPRGGLVELLLDEPGVGELSLLGPALASLSTSEERLIAWIAPPFVPYPPALGAAGIDVSKMLMVHPVNHADALWTFEQVLKTGTCCALLGWLAERELKFAEIRRLQFAARQGRTWASLFRPATAAANASPPNSVCACGRASGSRVRRPVVAGCDWISSSDAAVGRCRVSKSISTRRSETAGHALASVALPHARP